MRRFESPNILRMFGICVQNEDGGSGCKSQKIWKLCRSLYGGVTNSSGLMQDPIPSSSSSWSTVRRETSERFWTRTLNSPGLEKHACVWMQHKDSTGSVLSYLLLLENQPSTFKYFQFTSYQFTILLQQLKSLSSLLGSFPVPTAQLFNCHCLYVSKGLASYCLANFFFFVYI